MPSFAEGYGLPLAEANAAGVRVIASDIPVFREIAEGSFVSLSPIDGMGWLRAIEDFSGEFWLRRPSETPPLDKSDSFFEKIEAFINSL